MPVTGLIAGGLGAAGSIGSALIGSNAAQAASGQQTALGLAGLTQQSNMFNAAANALGPYFNSGVGAVPYLSSVLNQMKSLTSPGSSAASLASMPGFQFQQYWGTKAAQNALTSQGLGGSTGPLATAISQYNQGLAGTYFQNEFNALAQEGGVAQNLLSTGASAASALAGNATASGSAQAQTLQNIGSAQAAGTLGSANAISGGIQGGTSSISNALLLSSLLGSGSQGIYNSPNVAGGPDIYPS